MYWLGMNAMYQMEIADGSIEAKHYVVEENGCKKVYTGHKRNADTLTISIGEITKQFKNMRTEAGTVILEDDHATYTYKGMNLFADRQEAETCITVYRLESTIQHVFNKMIQLHDGRCLKAMHIPL